MRFLSPLPTGARDRGWPGNFFRTSVSMQLPREHLSLTSIFSPKGRGSERKARITS
jgi:hypothetical protein